MGSLQNCCRLCGMTVPASQQNAIKTDPVLSTKIRNFVGIDLTENDFSDVACSHCINVLEFCVQFVDRCRQLQTVVAENSFNLEAIQSQLLYLYPFLYHQSNPYQSGSAQDYSSYLGHNQTEASLEPTEIPLQRINQPRKQNLTGKNSSENILVAVESHEMFDPKKQETKPARPVRKILPKSSTNDLGGSSSVGLMSIKTSTNQIMIPITLKTPCRHCGVTISASSVQDLRDHLCSKEKTFQCSEDGCLKKFSSKSSLKYHVRHFHNQSKDSPEKIVDKLAPPTPVLAELVAGPSGKFACTHPGCPKSYSAKSYLIEHFRKHTGEKPFKCKNCEKTFSRILDMKKHQLLKVCE